MIIIIYVSNISDRIFVPKNVSIRELIRLLQILQINICFVSYSYGYTYFFCLN